MRTVLVLLGATIVGCSGSSSHQRSEQTTQPHPRDEPARLAGDSEIPRVRSERARTRAHQDAVPASQIEPAPSPLTCVPVYLGGCPVGCAPVTPAALSVGATVHACGWDHRVARVSVPDSEGGGDAMFLIPLPPPDTHFVGVRCSARRPDAAQCEGRCNEGCAMEDISPSFGPGA